jgi:uncharacterized membrane protein
VDANDRGKGTPADGSKRRRLGERLRGEFAWGRLYRHSSYLKSALWTVPLVSIVLVLALAPAVHLVDNWLQWRPRGLQPAGASAMYQTVITLALSFLVFTFGSLLVAIQVAGGQLTSQIIATVLLRNNVVRYSVGLFVFALVFAVGALNRQASTVNELVAFVVAVLGVACIAVFLFLIDYAARLLRPVNVLTNVGESGVRVIKSVYPTPASALPPEVVVPDAREWHADTRVVEHRGTSSILLAADLPSLVAMACRHDGVIEVVPQVGDFVALDEPMFVLHGGARAIDDDEVRSAVAFGPERTLEEDPMFALRIIVDIALKALSTAINDPTTAVLALDQLHRLLRLVGLRQLRGEVMVDGSGAPRVIFRTPNWEDFVHVACCEIRANGAGSVQVARRMRAMLVDLRSTLPEHRHATLEQELGLLDRAIQRRFAEVEDLALARIPDSQGLGGSSDSRLEKDRP